MPTTIKLVRNFTSCRTHLDHTKCFFSLSLEYRDLGLILHTSMWQMCITVVLLKIFIIQVRAIDVICYQDSSTVLYCDELTYCCQLNKSCCDFDSSVSTPVKYGHFCEQIKEDVYFCVNGDNCCRGNTRCCPNSESSLSGGAIAGIVIGSIVGCVIFIGIRSAIRSKCKESSTQVTPVHIQKYRDLGFELILHTSMWQMNVRVVLLII